MCLVWNFVKNIPLCRIFIKLELIALDIVDLKDIEIFYTTRVQKVLSNTSLTSIDVQSLDFSKNLLFITTYRVSIRFRSNVNEIVSPCCLEYFFLKYSFLRLRYVLQISG